MSTVLTPSTHFEQIKDCVKVDDKGRVGLGKVYASKNYRIACSEQGDILLTPMAIIPEKEHWLYSNPEAYAMFKEGLEAARQGLVTPAIDYSMYADDVLEDD